MERKSWPKPRRPASKEKLPTTDLRSPFCLCIPDEIARLCAGRFIHELSSFLK
jgi:hypothetical protein